MFFVEVDCGWRCLGKYSLTEFLLTDNSLQCTRTNKTTSIFHGFNYCSATMCGSQETKQMNSNELFRIFKLHNMSI
ncbi:CLUMA_CG001184, isoform A [Clunio marinus]|uniref:CLUMA_CG001184, isoform A n=1 Tax=Clunio marinus TaxID=568069 RepID=A0A1J1HLP8_9DIPT|nr:CLUMA_CG001184, isoform A [Clunio marinus]